MSSFVNYGKCLPLIKIKNFILISLLVATLIPVASRYTGLSISYNIASALFGGTAPLMATVIMERSGNALAPGWYVSLCAVLSLIALSTIREERKETAEIPAGTH